MLLEETVKTCHELEGRTVKSARIVAKPVTGDHEVQIWFTDGVTCTIGLFRHDPLPTEFYIDVAL